MVPPPPLGSSFRFPDIRSSSRSAGVVGGLSSPTRNRLAPRGGGWNGGLFRSNRSVAWRIVRWADRPRRGVGPDTSLSISIMSLRPASNDRAKNCTAGFDTFCLGRINSARLSGDPPFDLIDRSTSCFVPCGLKAGSIFFPIDRGSIRLSRTVL